jgi:hypothetical protein
MELNTSTTPATDTTTPAAEPDNFENVDLSDMPQDDSDDEGEEAVQQEAPAKAEPQADPSKVTDKQTTPVEDAIEVTINGKAEKLTRKEAEQLIGRGKAWKEQQQEIDRLRKLEKDAGDDMDFLDQMAKKAGMSRAEYKREVQKQELVGAGMDAATADAILAERASHADDKRIADEVRKKAEADAKAQARRDADFAEFTETYPEVKAADIPQEVRDMTRAGKSLIGAYAQYQLAHLKTKISQYEQQEKNKQLSTGSVATAGEKGGNTDPFLEGWNS